MCFHVLLFVGLDGTVTDSFRLSRSNERLASSRVQDRAGEWRFLADRALVRQFALFEKRRDRALTARASVSVYCLLSAAEVSARATTADIRAIDSYRHHLALGADKGLLALPGSFVGARASVHREKRATCDDEQRKRSQPGLGPPNS